jgi:DNA-binding transcriptional regulator YiaG
MHRYIESGLTNVWLSSGYRVEDTPYGKTVIIDDEAMLLRAIAEDLVAHKRQLEGNEFRFLRNLMGLTQTELSAKLGNKLLTICRWEGGETPIPAWADRVIRQLCLEHLGERPRLRDLIENTPRLPDAPRFEFKHTSVGAHRWASSVKDNVHA